VNRAINFGLKSSLKTVKAKHVSVSAYQNRSIKCSNSAARNVPRKICGQDPDDDNTSTNKNKWAYLLFSLTSRALKLILTIENRLPETIAFIN
jgi:hypothetical protein